jgi:hypothetical protein
MSVKIKQAKWSAKEMLALPEWEAQRDTPKRAIKYLNRPDFDPKNTTIQTGFATVVVDGIESRVNGNVRSFVENHHLHEDFLYPSEVFGDRYICSTKDEAQIVYNSIDNSSTSKGASDKLTSALKACGVGVRSKMFKAGRGTSGLAIAWRALRGQVSNSAWWKTEDMVTEFSNEIKLIDKLMTENNVAIANPVISCPGVQMGMLLTLYRARLTPPRRGARGESVQDVYGFWERVIQTEGKVALGGLGTCSPVVKMWNTVKTDLAEATDRGQRSRITWYHIASKVLYIFEHRASAEIKKVLKDEKGDIIKDFFPCFTEEQAKAVA